MNDKYLGNIQRNGTYSLVPWIGAGKVTSEKFTGIQRVDLFGVSKIDSPKIWEELGRIWF
ncbi:unnamed protein product [Debaryomyces tyrocola]|nr:unnamed protein product [Debaryomyces tyrocola]